jgi:hypothetical protein
MRAEEELDVGEDGGRGYHQQEVQSSMRGDGI